MHRVVVAYGNKHNLDSNMLAILFTTPYVRDYASSFLFAEERANLASTCKILHENQINWRRQNWREIIVDPLLKYYKFNSCSVRPFSNWFAAQVVLFIYFNYAEAFHYICNDMLNVVRSYAGLPPETSPKIPPPTVNDIVNRARIKQCGFSVSVFKSLHWISLTPLETLGIMTYPGTKRLLFPNIKYRCEDPIYTVEADIYALRFKPPYTVLSSLIIEQTPVHKVMLHTIYLACGKKNAVSIRHTMSQFLYQIHNHQNVKRLTPRQHQMLHEARNDPELEGKLHRIWDCNWEKHDYFSPHWDIELTATQKWQTGKGADQREMLRRHMRRRGKKGNLNKRRKLD